MNVVIAPSPAYQSQIYVENESIIENILIFAKYSNENSSFKRTSPQNVKIKTLTSIKMKCSSHYILSFA